MTGPFVMHLDGLSQLLDDIFSFDSVVAEKVSRLDSEMSKLHAVWVGEAATAQAAAHSRLKEGIAAMRDGLIAMREAGTTAHENYTGAVQANRSMFDGLG